MQNLLYKQSIKRNRPFQYGLYKYVQGCYHQLPDLVAMTENAQTSESAASGAFDSISGPT